MIPKYFIELTIDVYLRPLTYVLSNRSVHTGMIRIRPEGFQSEVLYNAGRHHGCDRKQHADADPLGHGERVARPGHSRVDQSVKQRQQ